MNVQPIRMEMLQPWMFVYSWLASLLVCGKATRLPEWKTRFVNCNDPTTGVLLFVVIIVCCVTLTTARSTCDKGVITPRNPYFLLGQNITLTCSRKKHHAIQLIFKRGQNATEVDQRYIHRLNSTSVQLVIENVTAMDVELHNKRMNYMCYDRRTNSDRCLDNIFVKLDYHPVEAQNVMCRIYNWDTMTCTWSLGVNYIHPRDVNITCEFIVDMIQSELVYRLSEEVDYWGACPDQNVTACHWDSASFTDPAFTWVRVTVTNTVLGVAANTRVLEFQSHNIVEPAPVSLSSLHLTPTNASACVIISWLPVKQYRSHYCELKLESSCSHPETEYSRYHRPDDQQAVAQVCGLIANAEYSGTLRCRSLDDNDKPAGFWSRRTLFQYRSPATAPPVNPVVRDGLFEIVNNNNNNNTDHHNTVQLYIQPLSDCQTHSGSVYYNVTWPHASVTVHHPSHNAELHLPAASTNQIQVFAASDYGRAEGYNMVKIHPRRSWPVVSVELVVEHNMSDVCTGTVITRGIDPAFTNLTHTLVWCRQTIHLGVADCQEPLQWDELAWYISDFTYPITTCNSGYRFGVTTKGRNVNSGEIISTEISWAKCLYEKDAVLKKPLKGLRQINDSSKKSFHMEWDQYDCTVVNMPYVTSYLVSYCVRGGGDQKRCKCLSGDGDITRLNVSNQETSCSVDRVEPGTRLCVWVRAMTTTGMGPNNKEALVYVQNEDDFPFLFTVAVVGFVVIVGVSICCTCKRRVSKYMKPLKVNVPEIPIYETRIDQQDVFGTANLPEDEALLTDSGTSSLEDGSAGSVSRREPGISIGEGRTSLDSALYMDIDYDTPQASLQMKEDTVSNYSYDTAGKIEICTSMEYTPTNIADSYCEAVQVAGSSTGEQTLGDDDAGREVCEARISPAISETSSDHCQSDSLIILASNPLKQENMQGHKSESQTHPQTANVIETDSNTGIQIQEFKSVPTHLLSDNPDIVPHGRPGLGGPVPQPTDDYSDTFDLDMVEYSDDGSFEEPLLNNQESECSVMTEAPVHKTRKYIKDSSVSSGDQNMQSRGSVGISETAGVSSPNTADDCDNIADCTDRLDVSNRSPEVPVVGMVDNGCESHSLNSKLKCRTPEEKHNDSDNKAIIPKLVTLTGSVQDDVESRDQAKLVRDATATLLNTGNDESGSYFIGTFDKT